MPARIAVLYNAKRYSVNSFFAKSLISQFLQKGALAELVITDDTPPNKINADICVMRTTDFTYSSALSKRGIKVFNDPKISQICNDKYTTLKFVASYGIKVLENTLFDGRYLPVSWSKNFPLVAKSRFGHGGSQVFLCKNKDELANIFNQIDEKNILIQKPASVLGKDVRIYIMGGKIIASVLRSSDIDFRSNFSLGGSASIYNLSNDEKKLALDVSELLPKGFIGVDFLFNNGGLVLNEIEDVVGTRMLYSLKLADAAALYANYILSD